MKILKMFTALVVILFTSPLFAQENAGNNISFNNFSFNFNSDLATHANITQYLVEPTNVFPQQGKHMLFVLAGEEPIDNSIVGIRIYQTSDLAEYDHNQMQLTQLQLLLTEHQDLTQFEASSDIALPFLPVVAARQMIHARLRYVETTGVVGISYVTAYQQTAQPLLQNDFLYTFQGISANGQYYVSAIFRVNPESFSTEMPTDFDYQGFLDQESKFISESTVQLDNATPETFDPSLDILDAIIRSFEFKA